MPKSCVITTPARNTDAFCDLLVHFGGFSLSRGEAFSTFYCYVPHKADIIVSFFLRREWPAPFTVKHLATRLGYSESAIRTALDRLRARGYVERNLDLGLNGKTLYSWYWCGPMMKEPSDAQ